MLVDPALRVDVAEPNQFLGELAGEEHVSSKARRASRRHR